MTTIVPGKTKFFIKGVFGVFQAHSTVGTTSKFPFVVEEIRNAPRFDGTVEISTGTVVTINDLKFQLRQGEGYGLDGAFIPVNVFPMETQLDVNDIEMEWENRVILSSAPRDYIRAKTLTICYGTMINKKLVAMPVYDKVYIYCELSDLEDIIARMDELKISFLEEEVKTSPELRVAPILFEDSPFIGDWGVTYKVEREDDTILKLREVSLDLNQSDAVVLYRSNLELFTFEGDLYRVDFEAKAADKVQSYSSIFVTCVTNFKVNGEGNHIFLKEGDHFRIEELDTLAHVSDPSVSHGEVVSINDIKCVVDIEGGLKAFPVGSNQPLEFKPDENFIRIIGYGTVYTVLPIKGQDIHLVSTTVFEESNVLNVHDGQKFRVGLNLLILHIESNEMVCIENNEDELFDKRRMAKEVSQRYGCDFGAAYEVLEDINAVDIFETYYPSMNAETVLQKIREAVDSTLPDRIYPEKDGMLRVRLGQFEFGYIRKKDVSSVMPWNKEDEMTIHMGDQRVEAPAGVYSVVEKSNGSKVYVIQSVSDLMSKFE